MQITVLIPHWKTPMTTAYSVAQFLKWKGDNDVKIIVIDNSHPDESILSLMPFWDQIKVIPYKSDQVSSHGVALDYAMQFVETEWVITAESDSFPTGPYVKYYQDLINDGYDCAGSLLRLSGGTYIHPCGTLYRKSNWIKAMEYCNMIPYEYFPNMAQKEGFSCHLMVHNSIFNQFLTEPEDYIELSDAYRPYTVDKALNQLYYYKPINAPFHQGMGSRQESIHTFGQRTIESESPTVLFDSKQKLVYRIGAEPGQWFSWWHHQFGKKTFQIPTEIKWMTGKENQQQEYTLNEAGIKHIWAGSSYLSMKDTSQHDVYEFKNKQIEELYETLPPNQKIII